MLLIDRRFMFHGSVAGLAGRIRRPIDTILTVKGSAAVPTSGGYVSVENGSEDVPGLFSFSSVASRITADFQDPEDARERTETNPTLDPVLPAVTRVYSRVENLNIGGRLFVEKAELNLSSLHPGGDQQPIFSSRGSRVVGFRLDGFLLDVRLDNELFSGPLASFEGLNQAYKRDDKLRDRFFADPGLAARDYSNEPPRIHGDVAFSLVSSLQWAEEPNPKATFLAPHVVKLEDFGIIHFAEVFVNDEFRQVTLIRVQLGSSNGGDASVCDGQVNGHGT